MPLMCRSTAAEGLEDPRTELCPLVKYFAERKKIFNIHFRNVVGGHHKESGLPNFSEVWPDEGDVDMFELAETLYDAGYEYMLMRTLSPCCFAWPCLDWRCGLADTERRWGQRITAPRTLTTRARPAPRVRALSRARRTCMHGLTAHAWRLFGRANQAGMVSLFFRCALVRN